MGLLLGHNRYWLGWGKNGLNWHLQMRDGQNCICFFVPSHSWKKVYEIDTICSSAHLFPRTDHLFACLHCLLCSCTHSFTCSLTQELMGKGFMSMNWMHRFHALSTHSASVWCLSKTYSLTVQSAGNVRNVHNCMAVVGLQNAPKSFFPDKILLETLQAS